LKYRKKPVVIEAIRYTENNMMDIIYFTEGKVSCVNENGKAIIRTLEGTMLADKNDYIIKGVQGEFYPCKPDIFEKTYEVA
jgi:hypothetical protein